MELCSRIDEARRQWDVLRHPFYVRWERGDLSRQELAFYAGEYRHAVVALSRAAAVTGDSEHAREEAAHVLLWDDFAAALEAPVDREPTQETRACAESWSPQERPPALAVLYAVESAQPAISETKLAGLVRHYGSPRTVRRRRTSASTPSSTSGTREQRARRSPRRPPGRRTGSPPRPSVR